MAAKLYYSPFIPAFSSNGLPLAGASLTFYQTGTTTKLPIYAESTLTTELSNPVVANAAARFADIYLDEAQTYRVVLKNSAGTTLDDVDPYIPGQALKGDQGAVGAAGNLQLGQLNRIMSKLASANEDANVVILTDSTGDAADEWPYVLFNDYVAAAFPAWTVKIRYWSGSSYAAATTLQTGTGTRILTVWVGAIAGTAANRFAGDDFQAGVVTPDPDVVLVSYGHNGDITGTGPYAITANRQLSFFSGLADRLAKDLPNVPVAMIGQNPSTNSNGSNAAGTDDGFMNTRLKVLRPLAARRGWGFIDVHGAFLQSATPLANLLADDTHPNATGSQLWAATVWSVMDASRGAQQPGQALRGQLLRSWASRTDFGEWSTSNVTLARQTTAGRYQTLGHSTSVTITSNAAAGYISIQALGSDDVPLVAGRYVTVAVWQRVPTANVGNSGRIDVADGTTTTVCSGPQKGSGFSVFSATHYVDPAATSLTIYIYPTDDAAASANTIDIDRVSIALGMEAVDPVAPVAVSTRKLVVAGGTSAGLGVLYNGAVSDAGLRFVATEGAAVASAWTSDFNTDGFGVKQAGDTRERSYLKQDGLYLGGGSGAPDLRIGRAGAGRFQFLGGSVEPDTDNARDLGISGAAWRNIIFGSAIYRNAVQVVGARDTGWTAMTGTGSKGALAAAAAGTASGAYVQAELQGALNRIAALEARLKSLDAALFTHGLIGT